MFDWLYRDRSHISVSFDSDNTIQDNGVETHGYAVNIPTIHDRAVCDEELCGFDGFDGVYGCVAVGVWDVDVAAWMGGLLVWVG